MMACAFGNRRAIAQGRSLELLKRFTISRVSLNMGEPEASAGLWTVEALAFGLFACRKS
jgi:hypothetical protein